MNSKTSAFTENWINIKDINNNIIYLDNKKMVTGVKIQPKNIFIMDEASQNAMIDQLRVFYNLIDYEFWLIVADRPVDVNLYVSQLELWLNQVQNPAVRKLIVNDIEKADMFVSNNIVDTEYYILFKEKKMEILQKKLHNIISGLASCSLNSSQVSNDDLRMLLDNFFNGGVKTTFGTVMA